MNDEYSEGMKDLNVYSLTIILETGMSETDALRLAIKSIQDTPLADLVEDYYIEKN